MKKNKATPLFTILFMLTACNGISVSEELDEIDSLIAKEQYDSACIIHSGINVDCLTGEDQAHYCLLATQLGYLTNHPLPSDSLIDLALSYYNNLGNNKKRADAYYYKSVRAEESGNYPKAILYGKEAERLAMNTDDTRLQYKIAENLAYINGLCSNNLLQLQYAKKALAMAQKIQNKNWIAYSYNRISFAFANFNQYDSAFYYIERTIPFIKYVKDSDKAVFLMNIGLLYKDSNHQKAIDLFEKALEYDELPLAIEHLADVYYADGNKEKAYHLWKKALTINGEADFEKDNLIHSIISYDLEKGKIEEVSKNIDEIINIKDSILNKLKNDTIKDLQLRFDHEIAMHEAERKLLTTQRLLMGYAIILISLIFYIYYRKQREEARQRDYQDQLFAFTTEVKQLTGFRDQALAQIDELQQCKDQDCKKISQLEEDVDCAEKAIKKLNKNIKKLLDDDAADLREGKILYDQIVEGTTISKWNHKKQEQFNKYYGAIHYDTYNKLRKVKRATKLSAHNLFYLIIKEMGKDDSEIRRILGISQEGLRSLRNRTKPLSLDE